MTCPNLCAIRVALTQVPPERQKQLIAFIMDASHTRREVAELLQRETGRRVYPGSVTRHRAHVENDLFKPIEPEAVKKDAETMLAFVDSEIERLKGLLQNRSVMTPKELDETALSALTALRSYHMFLAEPDGTLNLGIFYTDFRYMALTKLFEKFRTDDFVAPPIVTLEKTYTFKSKNELKAEAAKEPEPDRVRATYEDLLKLLD